MNRAYTSQRLFERAYTGICRDAMISDCTRYRYWLKRWWSDDQAAPWGKCMRFAQRWGAKGIYVVNLFAYRATDPNELLQVSDPVGPENHWAFRQAVTLCQGPIVAAWGAHKAVDRLLTTGWRKDLQKIVDRGKTIHCLRTTKDGKPCHPLYVPLDQPLIAFAGGAL